jgi:DNA invertase Pin-like site-specific DNA recombinase
VDHLARVALDQRPELTKLLDQLRPGDTLVVWRLDRLGRSIRHLIDQLVAGRRLAAKRSRIFAEDQIVALIQRPTSPLS